MTDAMIQRLKEAGWDNVPQSTSDYHFLGSDALHALITNYDFQTVLDIGSGMQHASRVFRDNGKDVTTVDSDPNVVLLPDYHQDYANIHFDKKFDLIWCCHVLEHVLSYYSFLCKMRADLKDNGLLCITVPPLGHKVVEGHVNLWNAGMLLYNLVLAGFDCRDAVVKTYDYNISVIVRKRKMENCMNNPSEYLPFSWNDDGRIKELNW
jgi:SAM-dependent methyltransferase